MAITQPLMSMTEPGAIVAGAEASNNNFDGLPNSADYALYANGQLFATNDLSSGFSPKWISPAIYANTLYVRVTRTGGSTSGFSGILNTWQLMNTTRVWSYTNTANNQTLQGFFTADFSPNSNGTPIVGTSSFSIQAITGYGN
tara:strand:- start:112 stop:540 length:429 start_codon:yes stop_codon:yes gene_type:complete